jgi:hypothetical protein
MKSLSDHDYERSDYSLKFRAPIASKSSLFVWIQQAETQWFAVKIHRHLEAMFMHHVAVIYSIIFNNWTWRSIGIL